MLRDWEHGTTFLHFGQTPVVLFTGFFAIFLLHMLEFQDFFRSHHRIVGICSDVFKQP